MSAPGDGEREPGSDRPGSRPRLLSSEGRGRARRVPGWVVPVLGGLAGYLAARWIGLAFGVVVGVLVWRSRA